MNKTDFLQAIHDRLTGLPAADIEKTLAYYSEMIDDRIEDGMRESDAVAEMGDIDEIVSQVLMETPLPKLVKAKVKPDRKLRGWEIALLILTAPIWIPLTLAALLLTCTVFVVIWAVVVWIYALDLSCAASAVVSLFGMIGGFATGEVVTAVELLSTVLRNTGFAILGFFCANFAAKAAVKATKSITLWLKTRLVGKGASK